MHEVPLLCVLLPILFFLNIESLKIAPLKQKRNTLMKIICSRLSTKQSATGLKRMDPVLLFSPPRMHHATYNSPTPPKSTFNTEKKKYLTHVA